ncbi:uncharacterized protein LOC129582786 [Paramacrobiotus metropolitanus]|uniref:uncharacterized protein LOC129582786 n=1 Tax=Paramacrobiotus metropolitanus TaxID=2943436 RepID=UPI002445C798|nr:uncharacterized protein LOC129582786 [Paramacrobiotus metropolitanus]
MSWNSTTSYVTVQYTIATKNFIRSVAPVCPRRGFVRRYMAEFTVEKQTNYPEIPEASWTVTIEIGQTAGITSIDVKPKEVLENADGILVEVSSSLIQSKSAYWLPRKGSGPPQYRNTHQISSLSDLVVFNDQEESISARFTLHPDKFLYVNLAFHIRREHPVDLASLRDTGAFSDCTLIANDGRSFPAHRAILAVQSAFFMEMFQAHDVTLHTLVDVSGDVLEILLRFAYDRQLVDTDGKLRELWRLAIRYRWTALRCACEAKMLDDVHAENARRYLEYAQDSELQEKATGSTFDEAVQVVNDACEQIKAL